MAFWEHVNKVKVHSDFAKDASPTIEALHGRVDQAKAEAEGALREADLAIADVSDSTVTNTINQVKGMLNQILAHADAALATNDLNAARGEAAHMVEISRLDAWPTATLAVKQAGFTGSVRVQVKDSGGNPIQGALVTALTAPNPSAGITGQNGQVTITDLAAVRVMQVKAYKEGLVYHEVHVTVPTGGRADATITIPGPNPSRSACGLERLHHTVDGGRECPGHVPNDGYGPARPCQHRRGPGLCPQPAAWKGLRPTFGGW